MHSPPPSRRAADTAAPQLVFQTLPIGAPANLLELMPDGRSLCWFRDGEGLVAWGEVARCEVAGPERFSRAVRWWTNLCAEVAIDDSVMQPGTGPLAFSSFSFDAHPGTSVVIVPEVVVGVRNGKGWVTVARPVAPHEAPPAALSSQEIDALLRGPADSIASPGAVSRDAAGQQLGAWKATVAQAVERIRAGELDKVVLARDVVVQTERAIDPRYLLDRLSRSYPGCWSFSVDGLVGATPELLVRRFGDRVVSRVLAGTVRTAASDQESGQLAAALLGSDKDQAEHAYAVASVAGVLSTHCVDLTIPVEPSILSLSNVQHLVTDVSGLLVNETPVLALAASLHPTAAVCGTPTERALAVIRQLEQVDRGRYAGPVGWMDSRGDGEFGLALRCGLIEAHHPHRIQLLAGCGIVAGSDPQAEVAESEAKLLAMREALSDGPPTRQ